MHRSILIVDDEPVVRKLIVRHLQRGGWKVLEARNCAEAKSHLDSPNNIHTVLCDIVLPDGSGWDLIDGFEGLVRRPRLIVMTGHGVVQNAVAALRRLACDFLIKPFNLLELDDALARAGALDCMRTSLAREVSDLESWRSQYASWLVGEDPSLLRTLEQARRISETDCSVLITGESGTGKEMFAQAIHAAGWRGSNHLVAVNCGAIHEGLAESELFGHVRGAFTGATESRHGLFVAAHKGTMFLDEVGELSPTIQSKLLRVLQEGEVLPIGARKPIPIDTRIIAATNLDLEQAVRDGRFREDLYYRLNVVPIEIPPLRERSGDIPTLALFFVDRYSRRQNCCVEGISPELLDRLQHYPWPGNVRELENVVNRMVVLKQVGTLEMEDFPRQLSGASMLKRPVAHAVLPTDGLDFRKAVQTFESDLIADALRKENGNKSAAARLLKMNRTTLLQKLERITQRTVELDDVCKPTGMRKVILGNRLPGACGTAAA